MFKTLLNFRICRLTTKKYVGGEGALPTYNLNFDRLQADLSH
jgi:hypothetical protein